MKVKIYTDGGCLGTPGTGGWAFIIREDGLPDFEGSGGFKCTTNNRMEITAVLEALKCLKGRDVSVILYSDSQYVCNSINKWVDGWVKKKFEGKKNTDLWMEFIRLRATISGIKAEWVKGHNGHVYNERCNELADIAMHSKLLPTDEICSAIYGGIERSNKYCK